MIPLFAQQVYPAPGLAYIISSKVNGTKIKWEQKKKASPRWVTLTPNSILKTAALREMTAKNKKASYSNSLCKALSEKVFFL